MQRSFVVNSPTAPVKYRQLIGNGAESFANGSFPWPVGRTKSREATEIHRSRRSVLRDNNELLFLFSFSFLFRGRGRKRTIVHESIGTRSRAFRYAVRYSARRPRRFIGAVTSLGQRLQGIIFNKPGYSVRRSLILITRLILEHRRWFTDDRR